MIALIPARYASTRFPGKPLAMIGDKPLIQHVYENAVASGCFDEVIILTDDARIAEAVDAPVIMTSSDCATGTDRIIEAFCHNEKLRRANGIINIQGDEPCIEHEVLRKVTKRIAHGAEISTAITRITDPEELENPSVVKCVTDFNQHKALYFSRSPIPGNKEKCYDPTVAYYRHIGIYGFSHKALNKIAALSETPLQEAEDLEQLKWLENGFAIDTVVVESQSIGVDTTEDLKKVEKLLCQQDISLSPVECAPL